MPLRTIILAMAMAMALPSSQAMAVNWMYLANSPGPFMLMDDTDRELFQQTALTALNDVPDGEVKTWQSPNSDAKGQIQPLSTFEQNNMICRTMRFSSEVKDQNSTSEHTLCETEDGTWAFAN